MCCEMNGAMLHGKVAQFRVIPYEARRKLALPENIEELIDMTTEKLNELASREDKEDEYMGKDMQFHKVKLTPNWEELAPEDLSDEYESDEGPADLNLEPEKPYDAENPRRSTRRKAAA